MSYSHGEPIHGYHPINQKTGLTTDEMSNLCLYVARSKATCQTELDAGTETDASWENVVPLEVLERRVHD